MTRTRCSWVNLDSPLYVAYHDEEWGVPCHDETRLFEMLNLEGAQAGLSWLTVLNKRESYRAAFDQWDAEKIARYDEKKVAALLANPGIIRNKLKVAATIGNCTGLFAPARRSRWPGSVSVGLRRRQADQKPLGNHQTCSGKDSLVRSVVQGSGEARIQICRIDNYVCLYASHRHGE